MPDATYKIVTSIFYEEQSFSETFFKTAASGLEARDAYVDGVFPFRKEILGANYYLSYLRASNVDSARDARFKSWSDDQARGSARLPNHNAMSSEQSMDAWNIRLFSSDVTWRSYLMRGLGGSAFRSDGRPVFSGAYCDKVRAYLGKLKDGNFGIQKSTLGANVPLSAVTRVESRIVSITTTAAVEGALVGKDLVIRDAIGVSGINTKYKIVGIDPGNIYRVRNRVRKNLGELTAGTGRVAVVGYAVAPITSWEFICATSRRAGRPTYVPRGRRSVSRS